MKDRAYYEQMSNYLIATEILADPAASVRERILAQRLRRQRLTGADLSVLDNQTTTSNREHAYD